METELWLTTEGGLFSPAQRRHQRSHELATRTNRQVLPRTGRCSASSRCEGARQCDKASYYPIVCFTYRKLKETCIGLTFV